MWNLRSDVAPEVIVLLGGSAVKERGNAGIVEKRELSEVGESSTDGFSKGRNSTDGTGVEGERSETGMRRDSTLFVKVIVVENEKFQTREFHNKTSRASKVVVTQIKRDSTLSVYRFDRFKIKGTQLLPRIRQLKRWKTFFSFTHFPKKRKRKKKKELEKEKNHSFKSHSN